MSGQRLSSTTQTGRPADWDRYWRGTWEAAAHEDGSPQNAALEIFWQAFFEHFDDRDPPLSLIDVAAGNGAVTRFARAGGPADMECFALDYSVSALKNLRERYPGVRCVAADALSPPFAPGSFGAVVSQYGIEYAGPEAIAAAGNLVSPGGYLGLVVHYTDGGIYRECANNRRVLLDIRALNVLELARAAFRAGFALNAGRGTAADFKAAEREFAPAVRGLEQLLKREGSQLASGLPLQLYKDIAAMYRSMSAYAEEDIVAWIDGMQLELDAYIGRMQSMTDAAVDEPTLQAQCEKLVDMGFATPQPGCLRVSASAQPSGWTLIVRRGDSSAG